MNSFVTTLERLTSLRVLSLVSLGIWGPLLDKIHRLFALEYLDLGSNYLFGSVPPKISAMVKLQTLKLDDNFFNDTIPNWFDSLSNLTFLSLRNNRLKGPFRSSIRHITTLIDLVLSVNEISGRLLYLSGLSSLNVQDLSENKSDSDLPALPRELVMAFLSNNSFSNVSKAEEMELERYTDSTEGFTFLRPSSWIKVDKAGATVLFQEPNKGSNNVGVVVNPVRLSSLGEFGTPQFVAEKLIQAEKRKESTIEVELIGVAERSGQKGLQVYEFEYKVDSSRGGLKRIFSAAFVASRKLYLLNINYSDKQESPLDNYTRTKLEEVLHSFDAAPTA
ncbi:psbP domain-containing protein 2, chloroplastic-like [Pistacia vera]|uniref:psbP domain-containing protein 2, chloroplastic-like n=1 Tax=Pistacia vera TaxID=55513 RepID=UPI0012638D79|nr:psbP domain-containing protein 2, chloroplastic-like [Pistacia vera]